MIKNRFNNWLQGKYSLGVEVCIENEVKTYNTMLLEARKTGITIKKFYTELADLNEVREKVSNKFPVSMVITGIKVLSKKLSVESMDNIGENLQVAFPGMNLEQFYFQLCFPGELECPISVARKEEVASEVDLWLAEGFSIVDVYIGNFPLECLATEIVNQVKVEEDDFEPERKNSNTLLSGIRYLMPSVAPKLVTNIEFTDQLRKEFQSKKIFTASMLTGGIVLFLALLANFFFFNHYDKQNTQLDNELLGKQNILARIESAKKEVGVKKELLKSIGSSGQSITSFYADRIAECIPVGIKLESLFIHPAVRKKNGLKEKYTFERERIVVTGVSSQSFALNELINKLKDQDWVKAVQVINYTVEPNEPGKFDLNITIT